MHWLAQGCKSYDPLNEVRRCGGRHEALFSLRSLLSVAGCLRPAGNVLARMGRTGLQCISSGEVFTG